MDTPQLENGYVRIATEILDALVKFRIPGEQMQCLLFIIRKTYGYHKKEDIISNQQFVEATGLKKQNANRAVKELVSKNVVIKTDDKNIPSYRFNKNYHAWKASSKLMTVIKTDDNLSSKLMPTKDNKDIYIVGQKKPDHANVKKQADNIPYSDIINYLNEKTSKNFKPTSKETQRHIKARWNAGFGLDDFKTVINSRCEKWLVDARMVEYLRPETLFGTKFESYLNEGKAYKPVKEKIYEF